MYSGYGFSRNHMSEGALGSGPLARWIDQPGTVAASSNFCAE
jgi:hypothetical protein